MRLGLGLGLTQARGGAAAWTPAALTLAAWYKAGPTWCFADAAATVPCGDGDPVRVWKDRSGNGFDWSQAGLSMRPTLYSLGGGKWCVTADDVDDVMTGAVTAASGDLTLGASIGNLSGSAGRVLLDSQTGRLILYPCNGGANHRVGWYDGAFRDDIAAGTTGNQVLTWKFASTAGTVYRDGSALGSAAHIVVGLGGTVAMFNVYTGGAGAGMDLSELVIARGALTDADRGKLETYLALSH